MEKNKWKPIAIIFIILFVVENLFLLMGYVSLSIEEDKINECYYDICGEYPDADYSSDVCYCYDYDILDQLMIVKTEWME